MVYGQEQLIQLPTLSLYDTQIMAMALNAAKDMYDRNEQQLKDFYKTYGDFLTPIAADQAWWDENMSGAARRKINEIYARGGDPLRNRADMAELQAFVNSRPYAEAALMKQSAENAKLYQKARMELEAKGLYNPAMAKYDGPDLSTFSTAQNGVWDKMSPTPFQNVATFGNPYFEGMKPNVHRESRNGIDYSIESITEQDLKNVADAHFNELVNTPQGQMMFKYYRDLAGGDNNPKANEEARRMFNEAIADGQRRRIYTKDDYDDQWAKREQLRQGQAKIDQDAKELQLKRDQFNWEKDYYERQLSGSGNGANSDIPTAGAADQVALVQRAQYVSVQDNYYKQLDQNEQSSYKKLSHGEQVAANKYKKSLKTINDPKASSEDKKLAQEFIARQKANRTQDFQKWTSDYEKSQNKDLAWSKYSSSIGENTEWGTTQSQITLLNKAHETFQRQNILSSVDSGIQKDMNHALAFIEDENNNHIGNIGKETDFAPVTEAAMTGNRAYRYNSDINKINRAIKGKPYKVTPQNQVGRKYGNGSIGKANYNVIQQTATFTDENVVKVLNGYTEDALRAMGITKNPSGGYDVPIISKFSRGSQTWADVNTETDKRVGGVTEATKRRATRQATSIMNRIQ